MKQSKQKRPTLLWVSTVAGKAKLNIGVLLITQTVLGVSSVLYAVVLREIVNAAVAGNKSGFLTSVLAFVGLVVLQLVVWSINRFLEELTHSVMENRFKDRLFAALLTRDYAAVTRVHSGEWMNRLTSDTAVVADGLTHILPGITGTAVKMIGAMITILWLEPRFLYVLIPGGLILMLFTCAFRKILKRLHKKIREADGRLRVFLSERLSSMMIVRTFAQERQTADRAAMLMKEHKAARMKRSNFSNICNVGFGAAMNGVYVLGAVYCGYGIMAGTISYGDLMAILQLIAQLQAPLVSITGYLPKYYAMIASAERLMEAECFEEEDKNKIPEKDLHEFYAACFQGLELRHVAFSYQPPVQSEGDMPTMPTVLSDLNLEIKKGEYVAFTGPSGCGKSTVLKLMLCLYPLIEGERSLQTIAGRQPLTSAWRGLFAYVPQGNQLLSGSIRSVITFGDQEQMRQEERIHRALHIACAEEFVSELENGLDTFLGEHGAGLSEGQMQRIAIARAVFSDHPILLLDEATSSLDEETERKLLYNLRTMTDKTVILVTHRPAALGICDKQIDFGRNE